MPKGSLTRDTFEQLAELGTSTTKKTVHEVYKTFSPLNLTELLLGTRGSTGTETKKPEGDKKPPAHTPLDFDRLKDTYAKQDSAKVKILKNRLFQLAKSSEQAEIEKERKEREQAQLQERGEDSERKKHAKEKTKMQSFPIPVGKQRRSIFSPKKVASRQQMETRPASGKQ